MEWIYFVAMESVPQRGSVWLYRPGHPLLILEIAMPFADHLGTRRTPQPFATVLVFMMFLLFVLGLTYRSRVCVTLSVASLAELNGLEPSSTWLTTKCLTPRPQFRI